MKTFFELICEVYKIFKRKFILVIVFTVLIAFTDGIGLLMLIPLLNLVEISKKSSNVFLQHLLDITNVLSKEQETILILALYIMLISLKTLINRKALILKAELVQGYTRHLRVALYEDTIMADWQCLINKKKSDLINTFTTETGRVSFAVINYLKIISQIIVAAFHLTVAFIMSVPLTLLVCISGTIFFVLLKSTFVESKKLGRSLQVINQELQGKINDQLNGMKEIKSYGIELMQIEAFKKTAKKVEDNILNFTMVQAKPELFYKIGAAVIVSCFFYIAVIVLKSEPASMLIVLFIFSRLWPMFSSFQSSLQNIFAALPAYKNIKHLKKELQNSAETIGPADEMKNIVPREKISFSNVNFRYDNSSSFEIKSASFHLPAKKMTAVVGSSGAGKSTIIDLLLGLLRPNSGEISVDNVSIDGELVKGWRRCIGYVPQDTFLLNSTIKENLQIFNSAAKEDGINEALELAAAKEFVDKLPEGINTAIGDRGVKLSGGERQRIALARALLRKPMLLVLDEATSSLDNENEHKIQKAIENLRGEMTIVIIAHRLTTIEGADNVIVVDNGKIVEEGPYAELEDKENGYLKKMLGIKSS